MSPCGLPCRWFGVRITLFCILKQSPEVPRETGLEKAGMRAGFLCTRLATETELEEGAFWLIPVSLSFSLACLLSMWPSGPTLLQCILANANHDNAYMMQLPIWTIARPVSLIPAILAHTPPSWPLPRHFLGCILVISSRFLAFCNLSAVVNHQDWGGLA